jgi:DnaJ like chaperone protein
MRENHPDKLMAQGLPAEFVELANEKVATLNAAYDRIAKERGIK